MENGSSERVVPMRLFANWETDRASSSAVQRMFTMALSRMIFNSVDDQQYSFVLTVKLLGNKRTLRSNDIQVTPSGGKLDIPLNISFIIQYPHFLKRKGNILQIILQRRKRYKNRQIPGYKTLAIGSVNLSEVLQNGNLKEILLNVPDSEKEERPTGSPLGRILVSSCQSIALELENEVNVQRLKEKEIESEEEEGSSSDAQDSENDQDMPSDSGRKQGIKVRNAPDRKWARRKNLKQKFVSLLKKFKVPDEDVVGSSSRRANGSCTAKQLEELFEELENLSDSGPEMVGDNLSIISNPRPGLTPYFATASREVLPVIKDGRSDESDEDWSSELENVAENMESARLKKSLGSPGISTLKVDTSRGDNSTFDSTTGATTRSHLGKEHYYSHARGPSGNLLAASVSSSSKPESSPTPSKISLSSRNAPLTKSASVSNGTREAVTSYAASSMSPRVSDTGHSSLTPRHENSSAGAITNLARTGLATGELNPTDIGLSDAKLHYTKNKVQTTEDISPRTATFSDKLSAIFRDGEPWSFSDRLCVCSLANLPALSSLDSSFRLLDCASFHECRILISTVVARIQKFCNNSSTTPPCTTLYVIGHEKLINNILRAYVESLQTKSPEWINFLRFCVVPPPWSSLGRLIGLYDGGGQWSVKDLFERSAGELTANDLEVIEDKLASMASGSVFRLPIGEAMLQFYKKTTGDDNESQIFVPFLAEVKIGQYDDDSDMPLVFRGQDEGQSFSSPSVTSPPHASPPSSPHGSQKTADVQELQIEYWMSSSGAAEAGTSGSLLGSSGVSQLNSSSKRDGQLTKNSIRSTFRSFSILRKQSSELLALQFVKEKKKEKMLQKLGMKKGQKNDVESPNVNHYVSNVTRLICSGKHPLTVFIDGNFWTGVRFFQASMQWQTHVKHFPVCLPPYDQSRRY